MTTKYDDAVAKLRKDLEWRGPSGVPANFVCLDRDLAQALFIQLGLNEAAQDRAYGNGMLAALKYADAGQWELARNLAERRIEGAVRAPG